MSDENNSPEPIECRAAFQIAPTVTGEAQFMPAGMHEIEPLAGGIGRPIRIQVDATGAKALEEQRTELVAKGKRPYFDFDHRDGPASFWLDKFVWRNDGIYAQGEWTARGKRCVEGKEYRYFSPVFYVDNKRGDPAQITCRHGAKANMGGLTNDPAFHNILPLWAKNAGATSEEKPKNNHQEETNMTEKEIAELQAKQKELEDKVAHLEALKAQGDAKADDESAYDRAQVELARADSELRAAQLQKKADELEQKVQKRLRDDAIAAVSRAVASGKIPARNFPQRQWWITQCTADPAAIARLEEIPGKDLTEPINATSSSALRVGHDGAIRITAEDPAAIFSKMYRLHKETSLADPKEKMRAAKDFNAIYATEIAPKEDNGRWIYSPNASRLLANTFREVNDSPLMAADVTDGSLGTLAGTLVTQRVLELLKFLFPALTSFTTDFSDQAVTYNQTVMTRTVTVPGLVTYSTTTGWPDSSAATTDVPVTLNNHKGVQITFNEQLMASTMRKLFDEFAPAQSYALGKGLVDSIYANITDANFTNNTVVTAANFNRSAVIDVATQLNLRGVPLIPGSRTMLLYSTYFGAVQKDTAITGLAQFQRAPLITDIQPANGPAYGITISGFNVYDSPNLPLNNANLNGFAGSKSALIIVTRTPNDYSQQLGGASYGQVQMVTDTDVGITVMSVQYIDHRLATATSRLALMWGSAAGQGAAGQLIKSNTGSGSSH
jgi:hypothetical protein